jgi:hypothetical protein
VRIARPSSALLGLVLGTACAADDPAATSGGSDGSSGTGDCAPEGSSGGDFPPVDESGCEPLASDYTPRDAMSANDPWPACINDDGEYHLEVPADPPGAIARAEAFENIADLLWRSGTPSPQDFTDARDQYEMDSGIASRVERREDLHYDPVAMVDQDPMVEFDKQCTVPGNPEKYPDRCVGPARILPLLEAAFDAGQLGMEPEVNAARVEAGILWFFWLSPYKETWSCTQFPQDCDAAWAYYNGGRDRAGGIMLAPYVKAQSEEAHDRIIDGVSAMRCWREYEDAMPGASQSFFDDGWEQLDQAMWRGLALMVRGRLELQATLCGTAAQANWAFLQILGPTLDREAGMRGAVDAQTTLEALWALDDPAIADLEGGVAAIDAAFPCP